LTSRSVATMLIHTSQVIAVWMMILIQNIDTFQNTMGEDYSRCCFPHHKLQTWEPADDDQERTWATTCCDIHPATRITDMSMRRIFLNTSVGLCECERASARVQGE
jgi:hypothetical protein